MNKKQGGKLSDSQLESGTDKARNLYEKATGCVKAIQPPKFLPGKLTFVGT